jgi:hypothetical protein
MATTSRLAHWNCLAGAALIAVLSLPPTGLHAQTKPKPPPPKVNQDAQLIQEFLKRVEAYLEVHKKADKGLKEVPNTAPSEQVTSHQRALQRAIATARSNAEQGNIFTQPIRAYFRRQITRALAGPDGGQLRASIMEDNPGFVRLQINGAYPAGVPMTSMPPQVLAAMPKLPPELEFRFIGTRLILLDAHAQLVVDFMDDAIPN